MKKTLSFLLVCILLLCSSVMGQERSSSAMVQTHLVVEEVIFKNNQFYTQGPILHRASKSKINKITTLDFLWINPNNIPKTITTTLLSIKDENELIRKYPVKLDPSLRTIFSINTEWDITALPPGPYIFFIFDDRGDIIGSFTFLIDP